MANVIPGEELGLYRAMAHGSPLTPEELAELTGCNARLLREWLSADAGVDRRASFTQASAKEFPGRDFDLVCFFDCLHDMGDPVGAARQAHSALKPGGTVLLVEPFANDSLEENLNPVGRLFYAASTCVCTPNSLSQEVGLGLGAQAGEARLRDVVTAGGLTRFRRAAETPFNLVLEARP